MQTNFLVEAGAPRREAFDDSSGPMTTEWLCHYDGAVDSIVISTRRDFSYPTSACLLNYAN